MASFTELDVWKKARSIRMQIKELTASFPVDEKFRLTDQIIRSSRSIGNNIAKGTGDFTIRIIYVFVLLQEAR
jgi:four helix bundle protein